MAISKVVHQGSVIGAILLIAGCCTGAGMLGLPILTAFAGFVPSIVLFVISWLFMTTTGLLLLEVNLWFREEVSIVSMAQRTMGAIGRWISWGTFLFLFYSLMVAYIAASGDLLGDFVTASLDIALPSGVGSLLCVLFFGLMIYFGTAVVDHCNRLLMFGLILAYVAMVVMGAPHVESHHLQYANWRAALYIVPPMVISFGYHNLVPSLTTYLGHERRRLVISIVVGTLIPLICYVIWEWLILGIVPIEGEGGFRQALDEGAIATHALKNAVGSAWVVTAAQYFAFFAIVTSFLAVALSFVDFLADGLHVIKDHKGKALLCLLTLIPPLVFGFIYPGIFLTALNYAGAFGAVILFGILPAWMVWVGRYRFGMRDQMIVPGGRPVLLLVIFFSVAVVFVQLMDELGLMGGHG